MSLAEHVRNLLEDEVDDLSSRKMITLKGISHGMCAEYTSTLASGIDSEIAQVQQRFDAGFLRTAAP